MPALLFGSISTLADTSELQRHAFNGAFAAHDLDWSWSREDYLALLEKNGGRQRIAAYAESQGVDVDADAVHQTKSRLFQEGLTDAHLTARPGVVDSIQQAKSQGYRVGLVTTTTPENVAALLGALEPEVQAGDFDVVLDQSKVGAPKPDKAAYVQALESLGVDASVCVAVEDNVGGVQAALAAGIRCLAFPNQNTAGHDFDDAARTVDRIDTDLVDELLAS